MTRKQITRRGSFKALAAVLLGAMALTVMTNPAEAARYHGRGGGYGRYYGARRHYAGPGYGGGYGYGYRGYGARTYSRGYYGAPYVVPAPFAPVRPYYGGFGYSAPLY